MKTVPLHTAPPFSRNYLSRLIHLHSGRVVPPLTQLSSLGHLVWFMTENTSYRVPGKKGKTRSQSTVGTDDMGDKFLTAPR